MRAKVVISRFALIALVVCLVLVVQSRIQNGGDPDLDPSTSISNGDEPLIVPPALVTPTPEPTPTPDPYADKPDVDVFSWEFKIANYKQPLGASFAPDVAATVNGQYFDSRVVEALEAFLSAAEEAGFEVYLNAAYRPYSTQATMFYGKASQIAWGGTVEYAEAEILAREYVAYPGTSDHQLGLGADITYNSTMPEAEDFKDTPLAKWLVENCAEYGFILRYPEGKKEKTDFDYEPWHFRYVGVTAAQYIMEKGLSLEEFVSLY